MQHEHPPARFAVIDQLTADQVFTISRLASIRERLRSAIQDCDSDLTALGERARRANERRRILDWAVDLPDEVLAALVSDLRAAEDMSDV